MAVCKGKGQYNGSCALPKNAQLERKPTESDMIHGTDTWMHDAVGANERWSEYTPRSLYGGWASAHEPASFPNTTLYLRQLHILGEEEGKEVAA
ncbi:unnamed protein product [Clonostachys rhizophaga]|uniref:Uncharacterized protein n=1 Tax=Clonostachys rhizophaga TaxID=160324 RepID=A0A9N9YH41_9HYPO|nr:unnamed protein product [Clonostachys rhizophaga]